MGHVKAFLPAILMLFICCFCLYSYGAGDLDGVYKSGCLDGPSKHSSIVTIMINNESFASELKMFSDKFCQTQALKVELFSDLVFSGWYYQGKQIDHKIKGVYLTLLSDDTVLHYNQYSGCGISDWEKSERRDVEGRHCRPFDMPDKGDVMEDIYLKEHNFLYFGNFPYLKDHRPQNLNRYWYYKRKE